MHLKQLKLAGFKSFVEPTILPFPSPLIAVVGPNGCGKSNLIDAIRWVMGESLAKQLRGDSMLDVIFNGSSERNPVGQASVELVFDNSMGRLGGPYASYQEIAIKRILQRSGESQFYLNGSRCRRRDITDLFLGTGVSARGYSIIGQETISRLVEARPDELRAYLEEAAGISKYKERRRETLQRIAHTEENLTRVSDICAELEKQLQRLERQAKNAKRYTLLRQEERQCKAEVLALKWRDFNREEQAIKKTLEEDLAVQVEKQLVHETLQKQEEDLKKSRQEAEQALLRYQADHYQLKTDVVRLEEILQQEQREKQRLLQDKQQLEQEITQSLTVCAEEERALAAHRVQILEVKQTRITLEESLQTHRACVLAAESTKEAWTKDVQILREKAHKAQTDLAVLRVQEEHAKERLEQNQERYARIMQEEQDLIQDDGTSKRLELENQKLKILEEQEILEQKLQELLGESKQARDERERLRQVIRTEEDKERACRTEEAALRAAQQVALGLKKKGEQLAFAAWEHLPRLAEVLKIEEPWLTVFEFVLSDALQAIVLDDIDSVWTHLDALQAHPIQWTSVRSVARNNAFGLPRLSDKIMGPIPAGLIALEQVYAAHTLEEAKQFVSQLTIGQSIVTLDGYWLGPGWIKVVGISDQDELGLLQRAEKLTQLGQELQTIQEHLKGFLHQQQHNHQNLRSLEEAEEGLKQQLASVREALRTCESTLYREEQALQFRIKKQTALQDEKERLSATEQSLIQEQQDSFIRIRDAIKHSAHIEEQLKIQLDTKSDWELPLLQAQQAEERARHEVQDSRLQYQRMEGQIQKWEESVARETMHQQAFRQRLDTLNARLSVLLADEGKAQELLTKRLLCDEAEECLVAQRSCVEVLEAQCQEQKKIQQQGQDILAKIQEGIRNAELRLNTVGIHLVNITEALGALECDLSAVLSNLSEEKTIHTQEEHLKSLHDKIQNIGAVNLVAIEEYESELLRKNSLDEQCEDLQSALQSLQAAIDKMDKETAKRLGDTFDAVNSAFKALFPRLFGGGRAWLAWSCDNLLEAGVLIMAQPQGKRNASIHLLSGGEKALTAVAFIFAIFQLNPSPFCLLDEVDAPLDEANVQRFCELVREMSQCVQFLFITHNKRSMELADHIIGVTMREPGVSRIVAVDVEQALSIAE